MRATALLLLLLGCRGSEPAQRRPARGDAGKEEAVSESQRDRIHSANQPRGAVASVKIADLPEGEPAFVGLIVLDTLRADRTSLCGYQHPTTPVLQQLSTQGSVWTCDAYSPATWTMPAHASLFTGATTADHGVHTLGTPLEGRFETLAETYAARGYQTLFISANPVFVHEATGFWQGFDRVVAAKGLTGPLRGSSFVSLFKDELEKLDPTRPVFLVLNIFDAHDPYPAVPEGIAWAKAAPRTNLLPHTAKPENPYYAYVTGKMKDAEKADYLKVIHNVYPWAVKTADSNLGEAMRMLRDHKWLQRKHRVVITSDHGEHLGEHDLLRHGSATWQTVVRVPFLYNDNTGNGPTALPTPLNTTVAWHLLRDGRLPEQPLPVESASAQNVEDFKPSWFTVALWANTTDKLQVFEGTEQRFDLAADPGELNPLPIPADHPLRPQLEAKIREQKASVDAALAREKDPAVMEMLKSVGYVQDAPDDEAPKAPTP